MECSLSSAPSPDKCLSHQGMLKALVCQLQIVRGVKAGTRGLANTSVPAQGGCAHSTVRGEAEGDYFILVFTLFTLPRSQTGTQTTPELQAPLCCVTDAEKDAVKEDALGAAKDAVKEGALGAALLCEGCCEGCSEGGCSGCCSAA